MAKKFGLGKGLDALLPTQEKKEEKKVIETEVSNTMNINKIKPNRNQARKVFDEAKILELADSIKQHGIIQPIVLKTDAKTKDYIIVAGERRWRAAKLAGLKEVPVVFKELDDKELMEVSLIENIQRQNLNPVEEAQAYKKLIDEFGLTQEEVSKRVGKSRVAISNTMRLLNLDDRVLEFVSDSIITEGHGRALLQVQDFNLQYKICQKIIDDAMSVRETESYIRNLSKEPKVKIEKKKDVFIKDLEQKVTSVLGTKVVFKPKTKNKGKIEIEYYSNEELERILETFGVND